MLGMHFRDALKIRCNEGERIKKTLEWRRDHD